MLHLPIGHRIWQSDRKGNSRSAVHGPTGDSVISGEKPLTESPPNRYRVFLNGHFPSTSSMT